MSFCEPKTISIFILCISCTVLFPVSAKARDTNVGGGTQTSYDCTDETRTVDGTTHGEKWCTCTGGRWGTDCNNMLKECDPDKTFGGNEDYVCTSTSCSCTKAKTNVSDRLKRPQLKTPPTQGLAPVKPSTVQPPTRGRFRFNRSRFKGVMSRGIDQLPPAVSPVPEPPALPNFELQGEKP